MRCVQKRIYYSRAWIWSKTLTCAYSSYLGINDRRSLYVFSYPANPTVDNSINTAPSERFDSIYCSNRLSICNSTFLIAPI